jgi:hypothetical protein
MSLSTFLTQSYLTFPAEPSTVAWVQSVKPAALAAMADPANAHWWRCGRTWFVGVDALANDAEGGVGTGPALTGAAVDFVREGLQQPHPASHKAQVSVCLPGYPKRDEHESAAAHAFRVKRDSAHVDGLHGEGSPKRRFMRERHDYIFGISLSDGDEGAAPFVVWEGSHRIMQEALARAYEGLAPETWGDVDVTEIYQAARAQVFKTCARIELPARAGGAYVVHRFALHGVAPWVASTLGQRAMVYFRPWQMSTADWLQGP